MLVEFDGMDCMGLMWLSPMVFSMQQFIRLTTASLKPNNSNWSSLPPFLPSAIVAHDDSETRTRLISASTGSIVYTSQLEVKEITASGVLEAGQSEGTGWG
jgi:hypothetical protein